MTLAAVGSTDEGEAIASGLAKAHPTHASLNSILLPSVKASIELYRRHPEPSLEQLRIAAPYETGLTAALVPFFLRGQLYVMRGAGAKAAEEFQRILDHRGSDPFSPFHALAPLGLVWARARAGDVAGSLQAYEQFLSNCKGADPDIPVLLEARKEYDRLKRSKD